MSAAQPARSLPIEELTTITRRALPSEHEAATARCKIGASARQTESAPIDTMKLTETSLGRFPRRYPSDPRVACSCGHSFRALVAVSRRRRSG